jgi:molybdopterin synthase catalytic subunit
MILSICFSARQNGGKALNEQVQPMANYVCEVALVEGPLTFDSQLEVPNAGAITDFFGNVRPLEDGEPITAIDYEVHREMAEHQLRGVAQEGAERFGLLAVRLHHRIGRVPAGETSLFLRVAAAHRGAAFDAGKWIVDELKKRVPIWKTPIFRGGSGVRKKKSALIAR